MTHYTPSLFSLSYDWRTESFILLIIAISPYFILKSEKCIFIDKTLKFQGVTTDGLITEQ